MKRLSALIVAGLLLYPIWARSEGFVEMLRAATGSPVSSAETEDQLIVVGEFDKLVDDADCKAYNEEFLAEYKDELSKYRSIVLLLLKDDMIYFAMGLPLTEGTFTEGTGSPLMSTKYLMENISLGQ